MWCNDCERLLTVKNLCKVLTWPWHHHDVTICNLDTGCSCRGVQREPAAGPPVCRHCGTSPSTELRWEHCVWQGDEGPEAQDAGLHRQADVRQCAHNYHIGLYIFVCMSHDVFPGHVMWFQESCDVMSRVMWCLVCPAGQRDQCHTSYQWVGPMHWGHGGTLKPLGRWWTRLVSFPITGKEFWEWKLNNCICLQGVLEHFDDVVLSVGSGGTMCGVAIGNYLTGSKVKWVGMSEWLHELVW